MVGEFYAMVNFCNPGVLGTEKDFNSYYAGHITKGREPDATPEERALGNERSAGLREGWELMGGKFAVLARMLAHLRAHTNDKIVVVSNYTQTLELVAMLCRQRNYPCCSLNGSTTMKKRRDMVKAFNDPQGSKSGFEWQAVQSARCHHGWVLWEKEQLWGGDEEICGQAYSMMVAEVEELQ
eukprot:gene12169-14376_t